MKDYEEFKTIALVAKKGIIPRYSETIYENGGKGITVKHITFNTDAVEKIAEAAGVVSPKEDEEMIIIAKKCLKEED